MSCQTKDCGCLPEIYDWHHYRGSQRCNALDNNGHWCRRRAVWEGAYHGDNELIGYGETDLVSWVLARLCDRHVGADRMREAQRTDGSRSTNEGGKE